LVPELLIPILKIPKLVGRKLIVPKFWFLKILFLQLFISRRSGSKLIVHKLLDPELQVSGQFVHKLIINHKLAGYIV
jgi:hypothetical protein